MLRTCVDGSNRNLTKQVGSAVHRGVAVDTIAIVHAYELTEEMVERVRKLVSEELDTRFRPPKGQKSFPGGQRAIAQQMHISHATLNLCFIQKTKEFGIDVLLGLHAYFAETGRPMTLDQMLGIGAGSQAEAATSRVLEERLRLLEAQVDELRGTKRSHVRKSG